MNMKLTRLEDLLGGPSDPRGFGHNIISKKIRLMRKKCLVRLRNGRIFYSSPSLKMLKKCIGLTFQRRKWLLCIVWLCFFVLHTLQISYYITKTYLGCNQCVKKILGGCKVENSLSKVEKCQNILLITKLENVEKIHWAHVFDAQMAFTRRMALLFYFTHFLDIVLPKKLFGV